jgi:anti-anti-sigma regulatory factor
MLKISESGRRERNITLCLEGRLIGPWVEELRQTCEPLLAAKSPLALDLDEVTFADESGVELLSKLKSRGARLINSTPFLEEQLKRTGRAAE